MHTVNHKSNSPRLFNDRRFRILPALLVLKQSLFIVCIFSFALQVKSQTFADHIARLNAIPEASRQAVADSFMHSGHSIPWIEQDTVVHFVYNGAAETVAMTGDATGWQPGMPFIRISGTTFWYQTASYVADARLEYQLMINSSEMRLDPANPHFFKGGMGANSEFKMPGYVIPPETGYFGIIPHGTLTDTTIYSKVLDNTRPVRIYLPAGYPSGSTSYPVILFNDGLEFITIANADNILDYLVAQHLMSPVITVFVPPVDRQAEFSGNRKEDYAQFIATELMPVIDARYKTSKEPEKRAVAGISDGGNISLYTGMKYPGQFGKIAALSSNVQNEISKRFSNNPKLDLSLYLDLGKYDLPVLMPLVYKLRDILEKKGYNFQFHEWHEGHSWGNWKGHLRYPLIYFFPYKD